MALDTKEVRVQIPVDLDVILQVFADETGETKIAICNEIICTLLQKHRDRNRKFNSAFATLGLQSDTVDRRGLPNKRAWEL